MLPLSDINAMRCLLLLGCRLWLHVLHALVAGGSMMWLGGALPPDCLLCVARRPAPWVTDSFTRGFAFLPCPPANLVI